MVTQQMTTIREWFETGAALANQAGLGEKVRQRFPLAVQRNVELKICTPIPEVAKHVDDWFRLHCDGRLKSGAVQEDAFCIYLDPTSNEMHVADTWQVKNKTATIFIEERTCWVLAMRTETVLSALFKGMKVKAVGDGALRDIEVFDDILDVFYKLMVEQGHDLVALFGGMS